MAKVDTLRVCQDPFEEPLKSLAFVAMIKRSKQFSYAWYIANIGTDEQRKWKWSWGHD